MLRNLIKYTLDLTKRLDMLRYERCFHHRTAYAASTVCDLEVSRLWAVEDQIQLLTLLSETNGIRIIASCTFCAIHSITNGVPKCSSALALSVRLKMFTGLLIASLEEPSIRKCFNFIPF
ncbi:hypothetical protein AVEN_53482-1 [Araneus ventricosus]|uniref:Uncharacterized protein n=1 Tax=Araneus ventricosus TaxID=182803 RepID=A0A4Y2AAJ4_ARAVE|nr:hypothetical protein AVEN_53482-1 [Araneus ventricosus]